MLHIYFITFSLLLNFCMFQKCSWFICSCWIGLKLSKTFAASNKSSVYLFSSDFQFSVFFWSSQLGAITQLLKHLWKRLLAFWHNFYQEISMFLHKANQWKILFVQLSEVTIGLWISILLKESGFLEIQGVQKRRGKSKRLLHH